jgi:hypothetical protein
MRSLPRSSALVLAAAGLVTVAAGCTRPASMGLAPLDQPAFITSTGAETSSQVTMYRQGALDPSGADVVVPVLDATVQVTATATDAVVQELVLRLADADLPPSQSMPNGVKLRDQDLRIPAATAAKIEERTSDELVVSLSGALAYHASMLLDDGTRYPLGATQTEDGAMELRFSRYELGVHVTVDAAPTGACWSVPGILDVSNCSLYVESNGDATSQF